jgi:DnaJ-class molecular chaperone
MFTKPNNESELAADVRRQRARKLLGLPKQFTAEDVKKRYNEMIREAHPDAGGGATVDLDRLRRAKDLLLQEA